MNSIKRVAFILPVLLLIIFNYPAHAAWFVDFGWRNHHEGVHMRIPVGSTKIIVRGRSYYYYQGDYYLENQDRVEISEPPVGAIVRRIPHKREVLWINGQKYYRSRGAYYVRVRGGYEIMPPPGIILTEAPLRTDLPLKQQVFKINVPNFNSGYTTVAIQREGTGFVGPQGEYYPQFPTVEQLRIMYGR